MSHLIATIISGLSRPHLPLVVLESSLVQSCLPVLRAFVNDRDATAHVLIICLLYPPSAFADDSTSREGRLHVVDRTAQVPGYCETSSSLDLVESILNSVKQGAAFYRIVHTYNEQTSLSIAPDGPLTVIIDAADVLCADLESPSKSYSLIATLLSDLSARPSKSHSLTARQVCSLTHSTNHSPFRALASDLTLLYTLPAS